MKHPPAMTFILLGSFLLAQLIGLLVVYQYIDPVQSASAGETVFKALPVGERPPLKEDTSYWPILGAIIIGTLLLLLLIKLQWVMVWKVWFLLAVVTALIMSFGAFVATEIAVFLAVIFGVWKIFRPNVWVHNLTELFIYGGLAAIFVPVFNLWSISILLILIAIYDAYAVWKSKHMITLAKSQAQAKVFAGLFLPYQQSGKAVKVAVKRSAPGAARTAMLGGGDIGFPLLFAGVILKEFGLWQSLTIPFFALGGLAFLLWWGEEKKFYPAMPFIGAGCFLGLGVVWGIQLFI